MEQSAFILRISPSGEDRVEEARDAGQLIIGWSEAAGLLDESLGWEDFRGIIGRTYYQHETSLRRAGAAAGNMWRFIREMKRGDLVVVPHGSEFYVTEVAGPAAYDEASVSDDTAYRRPATWLNGKRPIARSVARSALVSRMKTQGTCAYATDLLGDIRDSLDVAAKPVSVSFELDLQARLASETLQELRAGRIDSFKFERLIASLVENLGAETARVIPRNQDKGADIVATFRLMGAFPLTVAIQAKHWMPEPPVGRDVVEQLVQGIEAESADLGMVITSGTIAPEAHEAADAYTSATGVKIKLVDGEQFAKLMVEYGIGRSRSGR